MLNFIQSISIIFTHRLLPYGDKLLFDGMQKAIDEFKRVLAFDGMIIVASPVGKINKVIFNAHRVCTPEKVHNR